MSELLHAASLALLIVAGLWFNWQAIVIGDAQKRRNHQCPPTRPEDVQASSSLRSPAAPDGHLYPRDDCQ